MTAPFNGSRDDAARRPPQSVAARAEGSVAVERDANLPLQPAAPTSVQEHLEEARLLLDQGLSAIAEKKFLGQVKSSSGDANRLAQANYALSLALEMQGRYRDAIDVIAQYEDASARLKLDPDVASALRTQIGMCWNYQGDYPRAIAILNAAQRDAEECNSDYQLGLIYVALARVYRNINEFTISRDYSKKALLHNRATGDWRGLAETYLGLGRADTYEGNYESSLENYNQVLQLIGDRKAAFLLGTTYADMAGSYWFLKRPQDGIKSLEKSISYYERTEHRANAARAYNNLALNQILVGQWDSAQESLKKALDLAFELDGQASRVAVMLDTLGELHMLRGDLTEAHQTLQRALSMIDMQESRWYAVQVLRTFGRCELALGQSANAVETTTRALSFAEGIGDRQGICQTRLLLAEARLQMDDMAGCAALLRQVTDETDEATTDLAVTAELQRLRGLLAMERGDAALASQHFGRCVSIFETVGDTYRTALAHYELGCSYAQAQPERASEHLSLAAQTFRTLGARLALEQTETALADLDHNRPATRQEPFVLTQLLTLRLAEAAASREVLLAELAAVLQQETRARHVVIVEQDAARKLKLAVVYGCTATEGNELLASFARNPVTDLDLFGAGNDLSIYELRPTNASPATVMIGPRSAGLPQGLSMQPLLRVVELGMDVCALRQRDKQSRNQNEQAAYVDESALPGFIHSSPAMVGVVEEIHKIRSSDVTVLVTGESGTGKELVSRAVHALSIRRSKVFVPFNCTAVPKELAEGYLFGYRRGAFTGAVGDSQGVIRSAMGGTLFLDEIGDLPLDVQPKLLRFLQEGEIQPLGDQRPTKVDVRIIAATNSDLETMVSSGRFREDLYYRLNVIRLRVPPLRERRSEIPSVVNYYLNHYSAKFGRRDIRITPQTIDLLMVCDWPGNVRQLCNELQRIVARAEDGSTITPDSLSPDLKRTSMPVSIPGMVDQTQRLGLQTDGRSLADALAELERHMIVEALRKHSGNISRTARELGLTRRGLYLKIERYQLTNVTG